MAGYVIKEWNVSHTPDTEEQYIHIVTRAPGILSVIMGLMGIESRSSLQVFEDRVVFEQGKWTGNLRTSVSLDKISGISSGKNKPGTALLIGALLAIPTFGIALVIAVIYFIFYSTFVIGIQASGDIGERLEFSNRGMMADKVDEAQVLHAANIIEALRRGEQPTGPYDEIDSDPSSARGLLTHEQPEQNLPAHEQQTVNEPML